MKQLISALLIGVALCNLAYNPAAAAPSAKAATDVTLIAPLHTSTPTSTPASTSISQPAKSKTRKPHSYQVISAKVGVFTTSTPEDFSFTAATAVPLVVGQPFGWVIQLRTHQSNATPTVKMREELILPDFPVTWGATDTTGTRTVSDDSRVASTDFEIQPDTSGMLYRVWSIADGDPPGRYVFKLYIEGKLVKMLGFEVK
jgi:hypothetical protein